jgi:hypothetical protein
LISILIIIIRRNGAKTISLQTSFEDLIIIRNGAKKISLQTSFGDLIRNRANTICLLKLRLGDIIRNGANTIRYDIIWLPNDGYLKLDTKIDHHSKLCSLLLKFSKWPPI